MIDTINMINRDISKELSLSLDTVKRINAYYWKYGVKKNISSGQHTSIRIKNLGTFVVSRNKIQRKIKKLIREVRYFRTTTDVLKTPKEVHEQDRTTTLRLLLQRRNELAHIYYQNQINRHERIAKKNMGK